jgi:cell division protein FtsB
LEFSFDRSRESYAQKTDAQPQAAAQQPQSAGPRPGPDLNSQDPSTIANERLRKAIERNRAKQAEREATRPAPAQAASSNFTQAQAEQYHQHQQASFFGNVNQAPPQAQPQAQPQETVAQEIPREIPRERPTLRARVRENVRPQAAANMAASEAETEMPKSTSVVSRRSVAKPEDTEFVPVKRAPKKVASHISYTTNSTRKKAKQVDPKYATWLVKGSWIFCAIMVLRLIFANGGITDFYSQKAAANERMNELTGIKKENMQLVREIERMRSDAGFQKKLVRDNLGFIAADEFLVLFPKEK